MRTLFRNFETLKIEVSTADFARMNKALITVLKISKKTTMLDLNKKLLYDEIRMIGHGQYLIKQAEEEGYIKRKKVKHTGSIGAALMLNYLTPKGKKTTKSIKQY